MAHARTTAAAIALVAGSAATAFAQPYPVTGIGNLSGGPSAAWGIGSFPGGNEPVVGETDTNNNLTHKACTFVNSGMAAVNNGSGPGGFFTPKAAYRINSNPATLVLVGSGQSASIATRAFRTSAGLTFELGTINPFLQNSEARGVNFNGTVVGTCWAMNSYPGSLGNQSFAFKWVPVNPTSNSGTMSMIPLHAAYDINDNDIAVGQLNGLPYQLNLTTSTLTSMGSLGGSLAGAATSNNNAGVAVGYSPATSSFRHAFRWSGSMQDVHPAVLGATAESFAWDINNAGLIVGQFHGPSTGSGGHAFIYNPSNGIWRNLNTWLPPNSGWVLLSATGISDGNCVVGRGLHNGQPEGFKMCVSAPQPPQAPCGGGPINPIPSQAVCPGGTATFTVDTSATGGAPAEVEWTYARRIISSNDFHHNRIVDGMNADPNTGEPLFNAAIGGGGRNLAITPVPGPGTVPQVGDALIVVALVRGPCDTLYSPAAIAFASPADVGVQGGEPGKDGAYDNNDFVSFIELFFTTSPAADVGIQGGLLGSDGVHDNNDFVVFIDQFFDACG
ncbi:MAG TPA: GC-type dockerin domain-anchored protein [Phycisphaerales bacterium]|nr:GC-type dockerin domain-anchored protein [Phycisphaerales bacterium]